MNHDHQIGFFMAGHILQLVHDFFYVLNLLLLAVESLLIFLRVDVACDVIGDLVKHCFYCGGSMVTVDDDFGHLDAVREIVDQLLLGSNSVD